MDVPRREVRAVSTDRTITVYQAYPARIADPALAAGRFVDPFSRSRMTWIKPSFRWMLYRCGWASKPDQERVLAVEITRDGFEWALSRAALSHYDRDHHADADEWRRAVKASPVRVQWDPERDLRLAPLPHRSLQVGLSGVAVERYVDEWTVALTDVTDLARRIGRLVADGELDAAAAALPPERPYPLPAQVAAAVGADQRSPVRASPVTNERCANAKSSSTGSADSSAPDISVG